MGHDEALRLLVRLGRESMAALDAAHGLAENSTPEKRSEAEYIRGWALWLLKRYGKEVVNDRPVKSPGTSTAVSGGEEPNSFSIGQEDILSSFRQTVASDPKNAGYWHSLGLALVPRNVDAASEGGYDKYVSGEAIHQAAEVEEAIRAFERALSIKPSDPDMLYQAAMIVAPTSAEKAVKYLERAAQRVGMNAVLWYVLAQQRFRQFDTQGKNAERGLVAKAITAIENGNSAPQYWAIPFKLPTPILLRKAWDYSRVYGFGEDAHVVMVLTYRLSELVTNEMKHGEEELELRAIAAMMRMGLKAIGRLDASDLDRRDPRMRELHKARLTMGLVSCFKAYQLLKDAHQARPDPRKARVLAEFAGLMEYLKPLDQEVSQLP
jgi:tetratricopeptide (TPR) repeat protein